MDRLIVFDGNSILNRAFYGVRPLSTKDGFPTNALFGFINIIKKNMQSGFTHAAIAFDLHAPTFRHKKCDYYKANRHGMPEDLARQLPVAKELAKALGINLLEAEGYEADDIIGTISRICTENKIECIIVTGDRDSYQLVDENVTVWLAATNETKITDIAAIAEMYGGLSPKQLIDVKAVMGDSSDNIKGVTGIGEKGAVALIKQYGSLDGVYEHINEIKGATQTKLNTYKDDAYLSRFLAEICKTVPIDENPQSYILHETDIPTLKEIYTKLEFHNMLSNLTEDTKPAEKAQIEIPKKSISDIAEIPSGTLYAEINGESTEIFAENGDTVYRVPTEIVSDIIKGRRVVFWSAKDAIRLLLDGGYGFYPESYGDVSLLAYIVSQTEGDLSIEKAALTYLGIADITSSVSLLPTFFRKLYGIMNDAEKALYNDIELPLANLLAETEHYGFYVDRNGIAEYGNELKKQLDTLEEVIYAYAGKKFNINSPKQLGTVLFEDLGLPHFGKTQNGYSTAAEVLEKLVDSHPVIELILHYRKITKLKSTYCDGLAEAISEKDGRIHTTFRQTLTKTGRLSSTEPNLQNIPVKTDEGRELRKFFRAKDGYVLIDADYSQIELRILAHISGDKNMRDAFINNVDIHTATASRVFGVPESAVTPLLRKRAKAVNFGIVYGIGDYSLGQDIGITKKQAGEYIKEYLANYPDIRDYLENIKEKARADGFVTTIFGRKRYIPELRATKKSLVAFGERVAMNTPIQGSAADIIKIAMVKTARMLGENNIDAKIILQVHDELILEASEHDAEKAKEILIKAMENAVTLSVPLTVDAHTGKTWYEAK